MASAAKVAMNERKRKLVKKQAALRAQLKKVVSDPNANFEDKEAAMIKLQKLPRGGSKVQVRNRCRVTGRPRGFYRKFQMSRISLRQLGLAGEIPGLTKSSW